MTDGKIKFWMHSLPWIMANRMMFRELTLNDGQHDDNEGTYTGFVKYIWPTGWLLENLPWMIPTGWLLENLPWMMANRMTIRELTLNDTNRMTIRELTLNDTNRMTIRELTLNDTNRMTIRELTLNDTNRMTIRELTLNDGQQDDDDEEKEGDVKEDAVHLVGIPIWGIDLVTWKQNTWLLRKRQRKTKRKSIYSQKCKSFYVFKTEHVEVLFNGGWFNLANTKLSKKPKKWLTPWYMGTHLRVLSEIYPMNTNMKRFR